MTPIVLHAEVMVHGRFSRWRGRVTRAEGAWLSPCLFSTQHLEVLPIEPGKGWSTTPVVLPKGLCVAVDPRSGRA